MGDELDDDVFDSDEDLDETADRVETDLTEKQRSAIQSDARRRLELRLEEKRIQKQVQAYDFDDDFWFRLMSLEWPPIKLLKLNISTL